MAVRRRRFTVSALATLAIGATADAARAGTASGRPAQFTAAAGERNDLTVAAGSSGSAQFSDRGAPIEALLPWCVPIPLGEARCDPDGDPRDTDGGGVGVDLGDMDDRAMIRGIPGTGVHPGVVRVAGGSGSDRIESTAFGAILLDGGPGDDALVTGPTATATLVGGEGADLMQSAPGCCAVASYGDHGAAGVRVTLDRTANDGLAGERDDVRTSGVVGSPGADVIVGDGGANVLTGGAGADVLDGAGGDDTIDATLSPVGPSDGPDGRDAVACGAGSDSVSADADDAIAVDCERVRVGSAVAGPQLSLATRTARADRRGALRLTYRAPQPAVLSFVTSRSTVRIVDRSGRTVSSAARFEVGGSRTVARARVTLSRAARRRLARSRSGALALIAQRVSRPGATAATTAGYERFNAPITIRRPARR